MTDNTDLQVLLDAHTALRTAAASVVAATRNQRTPCTEWNVAQVLEHAMLDQLIWAGTISGGAMPDGDAFAPTGAIPDDPTLYVDDTLERAFAAWDSLGPETTTVTTPLPQGELPIATAVRAAALDAAVHAWDITAGATVSARLDADLAVEVAPAANQLIEPLRVWGAYAPALTPQPGSDEAADLLRYLGRRPDWTR